MTTHQVTTRINPVQRAANSVRRAAFTLVELMIVILIIGLLAAIATPIIFGAMTTARQFTVINEMQQLNAAVERFRADHGIYPPAIGPGLEIDTSNPAAGRAALQRYLTRIAPSNSEVTSGGLGRWWTNVGMNLDQRSSLVFWLSGLSNSKQYPLSGNAFIANSTDANQRLCPYNANDFIDGSPAIDGNNNPISIDRNVYFEFKSGQLTPLVGTGGAALPAGIRGYNQPDGKGEDLTYLYRDSKSYIAAGGNAYHSGVDGSGMPINFFNPNTFQIVGPGMDGSFSEFNMVATDLAQTTNPSPDDNDVPYVDAQQDDNIVNFTTGRLDQAYP